MAIISENPQEEEVENPQEVVNTNPTTIRMLPHDLLAAILALFRRWDYPNLSPVCPEFRQLIASQELYGERLRIGNTETVLYAMIGFYPILPAWYILNKTNGSLKLSRLDYFDYRPSGSVVVSIGLDMYVIGGYMGSFCTTGVYCIDCRTQKIRELPSMRRARCFAAAGVVDGKIYVLGGCEMGMCDGVEVFDVKKESWSPLPGPYIYTDWGGQFVSCAVMEDKIYVLDLVYCSIYEPKRNKWVTLLGETSTLRSLWQQCSCVVDDVLYSIDTSNSLGYPIIAFDPKVNGWRPVQMPHGFPLPNLLYNQAKMANFGGKLVILAGNMSVECYSHEVKEVWCIEVSLERRQDGEFWGTVVKSDCVLTSSSTTAPYIEHCRGFTV